MRSRFSAELRRLRGDRGLSLAQLSALTHYSRGYLSNVENGRKPPTLDLARSLDEALGAGGALLSAVAVATAACPYRGLAAFGADDARWFFGREQLTAELVTAVAAGLDDGRPLAVFGVSGAGKSSLLHAGLLPAIARGALPIAGSAQWPVLSISPTNRPATALAAAVAKELGAAEPDVRDAIAQGCFGDKLRETLGPGDRRLVLLVDQFEEVFTTCESEAERAAFIEAICGASRFAGAHPSAVVVLGIRADFYGRCLTYPRLLAVVSGHQVAVAAMTGGQLVAAITAPAALARLTIEPGLVELLLRDLGIDDRGTADRYEPGALPLLSHALMATWQHRDGDRLTVAGYQATGGIHGAVAATAERTFTQLDEAARAAGRGLLLHLVQVGEEGRDTRRRVERARLLARTAEAGPATVAMNAFGAARLLVFDRDRVEITHEALLRAWPRLRGWIDADRLGLRTQQRLAEATETWERGGRVASLAYRGLALAAAWDWAEAHPGDVTATERDFLNAGRREESRITRRLRALVIALTAAVLLAATVTGVAVGQRQQALTERDIAVSRQAAQQALGLQSTDPALAAQVALAAYRIADTPSARGALLSTFSTPAVTRLHSGGDQIDAVALRPDATFLATGGMDGLIQLWDTRSARPVVTLPNTGRITGLAFGRAGRLLAASGADGVKIWDVSTPAEPRLVSAPQRGVPANAVAFSGDGTLLAVASANPPVRVWEVRDPSRPSPLALPYSNVGEITQVVFQPAAPTLITGGRDGRVLLWSLDGGRPRLVHRAGGAISALAVSTDGTALAFADETHVLRLWGGSGAATPFPGPDALIRGLAFNRDGTRLAVGSNDGYVRIMDVAGRRELDRLAHPNRVRAIALDPGGTLLAAAGTAGRAALWHRPLPEPTGHAGEIHGMSTGPDGIIATTGNQDPNARLWKLTDGPRLTGVATLRGHTAGVLNAAFDPSRPLLATTARDRTIRLWDITAPASPRELAVLHGHRDSVARVAFSRDGSLMITGDEAGDILLWDVINPTAPRKLAALAGGFRSINALAFHPSGRYFASGSNDRTIRLWDLADRAAPRQVATISAHQEAVTSVTFSSDGRLLATASLDQTARLWDVGDPSRPAQRALLTGHTDSIGKAYLSPDDDILITRSRDHTIRLWDIREPAGPALIAALHSPGADLTHVIFTADGRRIAVASNERILRLWDTDLTTTARQVCALAGTPITSQEWSSKIGDHPYRRPCP